MANGTFYVDALNGNDSNDGLSEANAKQTLAAVVALGTGGGNVYYAQTGANYVLTSPVALPISGDTTDGPNRIEGYTTTPGSRDGRAVITSSTDGCHLIDETGQTDWQFVSLQFTHTASTRGIGIVVTGGSTGRILVDDCIFDGCQSGVAGTGGWGFSGPNAIESTTVRNSISNGVSSLGDMAVDNCKFFNNGGVGCNGGAFGAATKIQRSVFAGNAGRGFDHNTGTFGLGWLDVAECTFDDNGGDGVFFSETNGNVGVWISDNIFTRNGGYGINCSGSVGFLENVAKINTRNAYGSGSMANTSGARNNLPVGWADVTVSADPYEDSGAEDYAPNDTAGGGAELRGAGAGGSDIGAIQHQGGSGGGGGIAWLVG